MACTIVGDVIPRNPLTHPRLAQRSKTPLSCDPMRSLRSGGSRRCGGPSRPAATQDVVGAVRPGVDQAAGLRTISTGTVASRTICSASLPRNSRGTPRRPCVPSTIRSAGHAFTSSVT